MKNIIMKNAEDMIAAILSIIITLIFLFKSPLHPWIGSSANTDSNVFKTVALMMEKGYMPYKDSFDHKGPFLYILNYLGNRIAYYRGIWVIEVLFVTITIYMMYKIARLSCGRVSSTISTLLALTLLFGYFEGGNLTEEYAMPCIAISIYVFLDYLKNSHLSKIRIIFAGIGIGIVLMLRPNMIAVWMVFCAYIFIKLLLEKEYKNLRDITLFFVLGMAIVLLPIIVWLAVNNDLSWFWHDYIEFNRQYSSAEGGRALFSAKWSAFIKFSNTTIYIASFFSLFYHLNNKKQCEINVSYLIYLVITVILMVLSGMQYGHYGMIIVPAMVYPLSLLFNVLESVEQYNIKKSMLMIVTLYSLSVLIMPGWFDTINGIPTAYEKRAERAIDSDETMKTILGYIDQYTDSDQSISVYGNYDIIYVLSNRGHATRYSYQFPIGQVMPEIMDEYFNQLQDELPNLIVIQQDCHDDRISSFLDSNNYNMIWCADPENVQSLSVYVK